MCPHTATAVVAANALKLPPHRTVCLATAHPAKFEEATQLALTADQQPNRPAVLDALFRLPERKTLLRGDLATVQEFVRFKRKKLSGGGVFGSGNSKGGEGEEMGGVSLFFNGATSTTVLAVAAVVITVGFTMLRFMRK